MTSNDDYYIALISKQLTKGNASQEEQEEILAWIAKDKENEALYFKLKEICDAGNWETRLKEVDSNTEWKHLLERINESSDTFPNTNSNFIQIFLSFSKYAAILLLGVLLSFLFVDRHTSEPSVKDSGLFIITGKGERTKTLLPDGTEVWINSCSTFSYHNDGNIRSVDLKGEAYFHVKKDAAHPFIVNSSGFKVKALGTSFIVTGYLNSNEISTVLVEGSVCVSSENKKEHTIIKPGQKATLLSDKRSITVQNVDPELYSAWRFGESRFIDLTFEEIAKRLERSYRVTFIFHNNKIKHLTFSGTFFDYESIETILKVIKMNTHMSYTIQKDIIHIY
jgi:ferric-dicitrate binding protein FerR (iron transport regulator)